MSRLAFLNTLAMMLLVCTAAQRSAAQDSHLALVTDLQGDVAIIMASGGASVEARWGTQLFEGDEVKTKSGAAASILFANNNLISLGPNSSITIQAGPAPALPVSQAIRTIDGPLLADVSGLTMHRTGQGDISALGVLRSGLEMDGVEPLSPRSTKVQTLLPVFKWKASTSMERFEVRLYDETGLIWKAESRDRQLMYPEDAPALKPEKEYLWQVEGEELLETVKSPMVPFTVLSTDVREEVAAREASLQAQFGDDPEGSNLRFMLGSYYVQNGLLSSAIASFEQIAERHPDSALPYEILGKLYTDVGLKDDAINAFQQAIEVGKH